MSQRRRDKTQRRATRKKSATQRKERSVQRKLDQMRATVVPGTVVERVGNRAIRYSPSMLQALTPSVASATGDLQRAADMAEAPPADPSQ
jgi:hypothetical protein